jgi:hypothetical protein
MPIKLNCWRSSLKRSMIPIYITSFLVVASPSLEPSHHLVVLVPCRLPKCCLSTLSMHQPRPKKRSRTRRHPRKETK